MRGWSGLAAIALGAVVAPALAADSDPYIWLEQVSSPKALAWVDAENARTTGILEKDLRYPALVADALKIAEATDRIPAPQLVAGKVANLWQDADHVRGLWRITDLAGYRQASPPWATLIDLDRLAADEKANWVWHSADCEPAAQTRCLIQLSDGGEDAVTVREFDLPSRRFVADGFVLPTSKQDVAWESADSLLVARDWGAGTMTSSGYPFVVKRVRRGEPLDRATEIFRGRPGDLGVSPVRFTDGDGHSVAGVVRTLSFFDDELYLLGPSGLVKVPLPARKHVKGMVGGRLVFQTAEDWGGFKAGALLSVDARAAAAGKPLDPTLIYAPGPRESVDVDDIQMAKSRVVATIYDNVRARAYAFAPGSSGWTATRLPLPDNASIGIVSADPSTDRVFLSVSSFLVPSTVWLADVAAGSAVQVKATPPRFDTKGLVTEQFEAVSTDGTKIPYFLVHRADAKPDGALPTILTAYGGFEVSNTPYYSGVTGKLWLERGGALALANIRGGGEFGPKWHEAALKTHRQVAYDDFAAVARDLIRRKVTSPRRLGIEGGSNGGLLMGVEFVQHPELWGAVSIDVPLLDMIRFEQIAAGASWTGEYGSIADPAVRAFWEKTSPYQNLRRGGQYPMPFLFTTTKDDRVGPVHARKFAARMKEYGLPYLFYENTEGGHSSGANLKETAHTRALTYTYFTRQIMDPVAPR